MTALTGQDAAAARGHGYKQENQDGGAGGHAGHGWGQCRLGSLVQLRAALLFQEAQLAVLGVWPVASHFLKLGTVLEATPAGSTKAVYRSWFWSGCPVGFFVPNQCVQARLPHISLVPVLWTNCPSVRPPALHASQASAGCSAGPSNELPGVT